MKQTGNIIVPLLVFAIILALAAAGFFFWQNQKMLEEKEPTPGTVPAPTQPVGQIPFMTIETPDYFEHENVNLVINTQADWQNLWDEMYSDQENPPALPEVDLSKNTILAVFSGMKGSGGHSIEIKKVANLGSTFEVQVEEISPGKNCITTSAITYPAHIVTTPKVNSEATYMNKVDFVTSSKIVDCPI